jgi:hypothetical protein
MSVHDDQRGAQIQAHGLGGGLLAHAVGPLPVDDQVGVVVGPGQLDQPVEAGAEAGGEDQVVDVHRRDDQAGHGRDPLVQPVVLQQEPHHPGVDHHRLAQQRRRAVARFVDHLHQPVADQRSIGREAGAGRHPGR